MWRRGDEDGSEVGYLGFLSREEVEVSGRVQ